jgi:hypothetical protein
MPLLHQSQYKKKFRLDNVKKVYHGNGTINIKLDQTPIECIPCQIFNDNSISNNPFINNQYNVR